jgi:uncharacterized protein (UPF0332 family)
VKSESDAFLDKAREFLAKAADMMADEWPDEAGRAAYLAGLHAAQALIFERTGNVAKTHRGVQNQLERVTKNELRFDAELHAFLGRTYNLKAIADYLTGPGSQVSTEQAEHAIATAARFVTVVEELIAAGSSP